jgi:hypothetical protein
MIDDSRPNGMAGRGGLRIMIYDLGLAAKVLRESRGSRGKAEPTRAAPAIVDCRLKIFYLRLMIRDRQLSTFLSWQFYGMT